jgi:hypothetical protein
MKHLMLDLETLATTADAVILSIGAVPFDLEKGVVSEEGFYVSVSIDSNLEYKRRVSEDTLIWWMKQEAAARQVFMEPKDTLPEALAMLSDFIGETKPTVWSNGADFDIPMLAHAFTQVGTGIPWEFWNSRCFRTYKNLPGAKNVAGPTSDGIKHNALADAYNQAHHVCAIHKALFKQAVNVKVKA